MEDWYKRLRINTLTLVKQGFTREEIFYIPLTEIQDYIRILNNNIEEEQNEIDRMKAESNSSNSSNDLKMAGNTMPGNMFYPLTFPPIFCKISIGIFPVPLSGLVHRRRLFIYASPLRSMVALASSAAII